MQIKIKKLHPDAVIPKYAKQFDIGADLVAVAIESETEYQITYDLGIAIETPPNVAALLFPRSSVCKYDLFLANSIGVGDPGYRSNYKVVFNKTNGLMSRKYKIGDRVCQLVLVPTFSGIFEEAQELSSSERDLGGFGSSNV